MTSQEQIADEIYAQQLQEEEIREGARLQAQQAANQPLVLQQGQAIMVKLHHVMTSRQIGEVLIAHSITSNVLTFEMANRRGHRMRVKGYGAVEFSPKLDNKSQFMVEMIPTGGVFLKPVAYMQSRNQDVGLGWYLSMNTDGVLTGQGERAQNAQWMLIAAQAPAPGAISQQQQQTQSTPATTSAPVATGAAAATTASGGSRFGNIFHRGNSSSSTRATEPEEASNPLLGDVDSTSSASAAGPPRPSEAGVEMQSMVGSTSISDVHMNRGAQPTGYEDDDAAAYGATASGQLLVTPAAARVAAAGAAAPNVLPPAPLSRTTSAGPPAPAVVYGDTNSRAAGVPQQQLQRQNSQVIKFPGYDANRDALLQFFETAEGRRFLTSSPKLTAAAELMAYGVLKNILHR